MSKSYFCCIIIIGPRVYFLCYLLMSKDAPLCVIPIYVLECNIVFVILIYLRGHFLVSF